MTKGDGAGIGPWWRTYTNPDDPTRWNGTTSQTTYGENGLEPEERVSPPLPDWLGSIEAECGEILTANPGARPHLSRSWYAAAALDLVGQLRACLARHDASGAAEAGLRLGEHVKDWRIKDHVEPEYVRGGKNLRQAREAAKLRGKLAAEDSRAAAWAAQVDARRPGVSRAQVYRKIAGESLGDVLPAAVEKAVLRYRRRGR